MGRPLVGSETMPKTKAAPQKPKVYRRKRDTMSGRVVRRVLCMESVADAVGPIEPGMEIFGLTMGAFSLVDLIEHVLGYTGPADVTISTWTAANADISFANKLLTSGGIRSLRFVVDFSFQSRQPAYCAALREAFGDNAIRVTRAHAKFVLIRNAEWNLVIRTSMNLNECRRLETFEVSDDPEMAAWLGEIVDELFANQAVEDAFGRRPIEHCQEFGAEWGESQGLTDTDRSRFFGDGPTDVDLRRTGMSFD